MSKSLMEVLNGAIRINNLNKGNRGGTFIQFIINEDMIPVKIDDRGWVEKNDPILGEIKRTWDVRWVQVRSRYGAEENASRTVDIIHQLSPFDFLERVMCVKPESLYFFNFPDSDASEEVRANRFIETCLQVELGKFEFQTKAYRLQKTNSRARFVFARILSGFGFGYNGHILNTNRSLVEDKFGKNDETRRALEMFYENRIGDALCLKDLPWDKLVITPEFLGEKPVISNELQEVVNFLRKTSGEAASLMLKARKDHLNDPEEKEKALIERAGWVFAVFDGEIAELVSALSPMEVKLFGKMIADKKRSFEDKFAHAKRDMAPYNSLGLVFADDYGNCQIKALASNIEKFYSSE
ncbi:hypothetical protein ACFL16_00435 [Patescibacteria group bacterium]